MIKERIRKIIEHENLSFSKFADIIGMQRSGISHILSGRNNPSLEVIQKILGSFDYINTDWLITGQGIMIKNATEEEYSMQFTDNKGITNTIESSEIVNSKSEKNIDTGFNSKKISDSQAVKNEKKIEKIIIIYSDDTFKEIKNSE